MTVQQMLNAFPVLQKIMELKLPIKKAYEIYNLAKIIDEKKDFFMKEEQKIIVKFNAEILENNDIHFNSTEDRFDFIKEHTELMNYDITDLEALELNFSDLGDVNFTPIEIMQLEGIIIFKE